MRSWTRVDKKLLRTLYLKEQLPIAQMALRLNRSTASKSVWELITGLGAGKSREWFIAEDIRKAPLSVQSAWLRAFFDDEAHFDPHGRIRARSVNRPGLEQVASMLRRFVPCHLTPARGLYPDDSCYLVVNKPGRERFLRLIGSSKYPPTSDETAPAVVET